MERFRFLMLCEADAATLGCLGTVFLFSEKEIRLFDM